jgi:putative phage-type endonuclease
MEIQVEQRSAAWHELRKTHIGASDAAAIIGLNPWKSSYDVFIEKSGTETIEPPKNPWMQRGIDLEPEALRAFEKETGYLMSPKVMISDENSFAMASFDGFEIDGKCAVEIKCGGEKSHLQALHGEISRHYYAQMQHQMYVAKLDEIYFCSYRPEHVNPLYIEIVKRDDAFIHDMMIKEVFFYYNHMLTGIPPKKIEKFKIIETETWLNITDEYKRYVNQIKYAESRLDEIKDLMIQYAQSENAKGNGITLQKVERKGIINYQNIPELKTIDLEKYRKPGSTYWQVKEANDG